MVRDVFLLSREELLRRICGEYLEMPGLQLRRAQAQRLWALDERTCTELLDYLVEQRFLQRTETGCYARLTDGVGPYPSLEMTKMTLDANPARSRSGRKPSAA